MRSSPKPPKIDIVILDDFGLCRQMQGFVQGHQSPDADKATMVVSPFPVSEWYELFEYATYADAILDRIVHRARRR